MLEIGEPTSISIDGRLPIDASGFYHLQLNIYETQTIHRIEGKVLNPSSIHSTPIRFESNLVWYLDGFTESVPTTNSVSIPDDDFTFSNMIAPILSICGRGANSFQTPIFLH